MSEAQQAAYRDVLGTIISTRTQEEQKYTHEVFRLLVIGNGAAIAFVAAFMNNTKTNEAALKALVVPVVLFFLGLVSAALIYLPLMTVASQATVNIVNQISECFLDKREIEQIAGYGLNRRGQYVVFGLMALSFVLFSVGVVWCLILARRLR